MSWKNRLVARKTPHELLAELEGKERVAKTPDELFDEIVNAEAEKIMKRGARLGDGTISKKIGAKNGI